MNPVQKKHEKKNRRKLTALQGYKNKIKFMIRTARSRVKKNEQLGSKEDTIK